TDVLAPQLQLTLKPRLVGIDNGPFVDLALDARTLSEAEGGKFEPLAAWKAEHRQRFLGALEKLRSGEDRPVWGNIAQFARDEAPWFVMAGRDDPRQKGYDVLAQAAEMSLQKSDQARFLFFPVPGDEGRPGLEFLHRLAGRFPHSVLVFPFLF